VAPKGVGVQIPPSAPEIPEITYLEECFRILTAKTRSNLRFSLQRTLKDICLFETLSLAYLVPETALSQ
jgi:hypothetical protein